MYCTRCGEDLFDDAVICTQCGVPTRSKDDAELSAGMLVLGYVLGFLIPLVGFIFGGWAITRNSVAHGVGIIAVSFVSMILGVILMSQTL
jgi:hypothetical protein